MSKEEIKEDINTLIEENFNGIWKKTKGIAKKLWMMFTHLFHKKSYKQNEKDYIDFKNNLNKKKYLKKFIYYFRILKTLKIIIYLY
jgi:DNA repair photolyase